MLLVGEMRDLETIRAALTLAETGHLVFATLHTNDAAQSLDRIVDVFPAEQQAQIRVQLAGSLAGDHLAAPGAPNERRRDGGGLRGADRAPTPCRNLIRDGRSNQLRNVIMTGAQRGCRPSRWRSRHSWLRGSVTTRGSGEPLAAHERSDGPQRLKSCECGRSSESDPA